MPASLFVRVFKPIFKPFKKVKSDLFVLSAVAVEMLATAAIFTAVIVAKIFLSVTIIFFHSVASLSSFVFNNSGLS